MKWMTIEEAWPSFDPNHHGHVFQIMLDPDHICQLISDKGGAVTRIILMSGGDWTVPMTLEQTTRMIENFYKTNR